MTCHARALGAQRRPDVSPLSFSALYFNGCPHTLVSSNPPTSHSAGWSLTLALWVSLQLSSSLSLLSSLSLSILLSGPPPTALHSLSPSHKGVFGTFGGSLSPPGFEPSSTGQKRCGIPTVLGRVVICIIVPTCPTPPCMSSPVRHIAVRMGVRSAACRGTAQRLRIPDPPA